MYLCSNNGSWPEFSGGDSNLDISCYFPAGNPTFGAAIGIGGELSDPGSAVKKINVRHHDIKWKDADTGVFEDFQNQQPCKDPGYRIRKLSQDDAWFEKKP